MNDPQHSDVAPSLITQNSVTLVPNAVAKAQWEANVFRRAVGNDVIRAPSVAVLSLWATKLLETSLMLSGRSIPLQPSSQVMVQLWETVIKESMPEMLPVDRRHLAARAMSAEQLAMHWLEPRGWGLGDERYDAQFRQWRLQARALLKNRGWITTADVLRRLAAMAADDSLCVKLPRELRLLGFIELTPLEERWLDSLEALGVTVGRNLPEPGSEVPAELRVFESPDEEIRAAARWARACMESGMEPVAVLVNGLSSSSARVTRAFSQEFDALGCLEGEPGLDTGFNISSAEPLSAQPLVRMALHLLRLTIGGVRQAHDFQAVSWWILSTAWVGADTEKAARAALELQLRQSGSYRWSLAAVAEQAEAAPLLQEAVSRLPAVSVSTSLSGQFMAILEHWGWPGPLARGVQAQRVVDALRRQLEFLDLAPLEGNAEQWLDYLVQRCETVKLGPAGGDLAPVQILAPEEAVGQNYAACWLLNVHSDNWPAATQANGLLPGETAPLLPRGTSSRQLDHARRLQAGILETTQQTIASWATRDGGVPRTASPLIQGIGREQPVTEAVTRGGLAVKAWDEHLGDVHKPVTLCSVERGTGVPLDDGDQPLSGAVKLLNLQSSCPWAAYLVCRLGARFEDLPTPFSTPAFAGELVHSALQHLYAPKLKRQAVPDLREITVAVDLALKERFADRQMAPAVLSAERRRLIGLLEEWVESATSPPLGVPEILEQRFTGDLAGFQFEVRIDRIDRREEGYLLIDYKTGVGRAPQWQDVRPTEVQLPLYAVVAARQNMDITGVMLATVRANEMQMRGLLSTDSGTTNSVKYWPGPEPGETSGTQWQSAIGFWTDSLESLLNEYRTGDCTDTILHDAALKYSGLEPILRWDQPGDGEEFEV